MSVVLIVFSQRFCLKPRTNNLKRGPRRGNILLSMVTNGETNSELVNRKGIKAILRRIDKYKICLDKKTINYSHKNADSAFFFYH